MFKKIILAIAFSTSVFASNDLESKNLNKDQKEKVRLVFRNNLKSIKKCYDETKKQFPEKNFDGKIVLEVNFNEKGIVNYAGISNLKSAVDDSNLSECFQKEILNWEFPTSKVKGSTEVFFPIVFESNKKTDFKK